MANDQEPGSLMQSLTKPKGAMLVAPVLLGAALLISVVAGGETSNARDSVTAAAATGNGSATPGIAKAAATESSGVMGNGVAAPTADKPVIRVATADKPGASGSFTADQRDEIGKIVRQYLLKNPKLLEEVSEELRKIRELEEQQKQASLLVNEKKAIFRSPLDFVLGNPDGDITVVEYFDYNCGWCKRALNEVTKTIESDKNVRVVMKEFPIFGEDSAFAAKAALASNAQNKYWDFHVALMRAKRVTASNTLDIAKRVGIDVEALKKEMENPKYDKAIAENSRIAQELGMKGTPGFIVDSRVNFGYVPSEGLKQMLSEIRKEGCKIC